MRNSRSRSAKATRRCCARRASRRPLGLGDIWIKDEGCNPTGSFKSRGLSAAITRASLAGAKPFRLRADPARTQRRCGERGPMRRGPVLHRSGICARDPRRGRSSPRSPRSERTSFCLTDTSAIVARQRRRTPRRRGGGRPEHAQGEPYRIEGKKTLGLEIALQLDWTLPDVIIYPTGGGTGLIGMWKAFLELAAAGWITGPMPRMYSVQSTGCALHREGLSTPAAPPPSRGPIRGRSQRAGSGSRGRWGTS